MTLKEAVKRIEELERKVKELEARPMQQVHYHYISPPQFQFVGPTRYPYEILCIGNIAA